MYRIVYIFLLGFLTISCSKKGDSEKSKSEFKKLESSSSQGPLLTPSSSVTSRGSGITEEEIKAYSLEYGRDPAEVAAFLKEISTFSFEFQKALSASDTQRISALLHPHISELLLRFSQQGKYTSDPSGGLPAWFKDLLNQKGVDSVSMQMTRPGYLGLGDDQWAHQQIVLDSAAQMGAIKPELLSDVFASRFGAVPSPLDVIVYKSLQNGFAERAPYEGRADMKDVDEDLPGSDVIKEMGLAKNPIFRMFAISNAGRIRSSNRLKFYEKFVDEPDPYIKRTAIEAIARIRLVDTQEILGRFQQAALRQGQTENAELAAQKIQSRQADH
jgi:hypothetical protein